MKQQRPLQDKELKILDKRLKQLGKNFRRHILFLFTWIFLALIIGTFAYFRMKTTNEIFMLIAAVAIYIGIGVSVTGKEYLKQQKERKGIAFLKTQNLVTVVKVNSGMYYEFKEEEDEGVYYLFQLPGNKVFSFGGQEFYPNKKFPSDKFEIVEGRGINGEVILLETFSYGRKLKPIRVIAGQEKWNLLNNPNYPNPEKLTVAEGKIDDYVQTPS